MDEEQIEIKRYYEEWWENPNDPRDIIFKKLNAVVLERLPQGNGKRALDIGSGKGTIVSYLLKKGFNVTALDLNENFIRELKQKFPMIDVIEGDFNTVSIDRTFDIVTAIEFIQNLDREALKNFLKKVANLTDYVIINISNRNSLHGFWTSFRGFQKSFVHTYTPSEIEKMLKEVGFQVSYKKGVGLITPLSLFSGFKFKIIPVWAAKIINPIGDKLFPRRCHLYYLEAKK
jgi:SAM-dependent methyltransferase